MPVKRPPQRPLGEANFLRSLGRVECPLDSGRSGTSLPLRSPVKIALVDVFRMPFLAGGPGRGCSRKLSGQGGQVGAFHIEIQGGRGAKLGFPWVSAGQPNLGGGRLPRDKIRDAKTLRSSLGRCTQLGQTAEEPCHGCPHCNACVFLGGFRGPGRSFCHWAKGTGVETVKMPKNAAT